MVRIPRAEPSLEPRAAMMPDLPGTGWGAPGRAMVQLGQSIASLGDAFGDLGGGMSQEAIAEQDFNDKMVMLKTDNDMGLNQVEAQQTYSGTGDDYLPSRSEYYDNTVNDALTRISPRNQPKAQLFFEQRRGPYLERDATFGGQRRQDTLMTTIDDAVTTEYGKLATVPPEEFETKFQQTVNGVDAIIRTSPLPDTLKDKIAGQAAERGYQILRGLAEDPETAPEIVPKILKMIETPAPEAKPVPLDSQTVPVQEPAQPGPEGVQGLPGGPSGPALPKPQKLGATDVAPPQATQSIVAADIQDFTRGRGGRPLPAASVKNIVLHDVSGDPRTRRLPKGGNIPNYHITFDDKGIYNEVPLDRQAPHAVAFNKDSIGIAYIGFEGDKLSPQAIANGARAVKAVSERFGISPDRILTHPGAGPTATKTGKDAREAAWRTEVLAYLGQGDTQVAGSQPSGAEHRPTLTAYSPQRGGDAMEGGYAAARPGPDGKAEVRTLADVAAGRSQYITLAGDKSQFGKTYVIPQITYRDAKGERVTLRNVKGVVHDTGSAFKGKGDQRFDIPVDRDLPSKSLGSQPFSKQQIVFIPSDGGDAPPAVAERGLTRYAGMSNLGAGDVPPPGEGRAPNTIPAEAQPVQVADASGKFVPQVKPQTWRSVDSQLKDLLIKNMGTLKRLELEAERKQDQKAKETLRVYRDKLVTDGFDLMYSGKLTREWVEESKDIIGPEKYGQFLRHLSNTAAVRTDPATYLDLLDRLDDDPAAVIADARELYLNRSLGKGDFDTIMTKANRQLNPETSLPPWAKELRGMFKEQTAPHGFASLDRLSRAIDARRSWDAYVEKKIAEGKLDPSDLKKYTLDSITAFRQRRATETKQTLPIPQAWTQGTADSMTLDEVEAATQRLLQALNAELATAGDDPVARKKIVDRYAADGDLLKKWKRTLEDAAIANGEKLPVSKPAQPAQPSGSKMDPPMKLGGPKPSQGTVNQGTREAQGVRGAQGTQSGAAPARQQPQSGESRPVGGALGVIPLAENPDGSVSLSVPGMLLEPWRAFQRGRAREGVRGMTDEEGNPLYDPKAQSTDAATAASVPLAATSFGSAVGAVPKGALGSGMARAGETAAKEVNPLGFHSGLDEALKGFHGTDVVTADTLAKRGVKKAELEARGLSSLLADGKSAKVSDLLEVAGKNKVEVNEVKYGGSGDRQTFDNAEDASRLIAKAVGWDGPVRLQPNSMVRGYPGFDVVAVEQPAGLFRKAKENIIGDVADLGDGRFHPHTNVSRAARAALDEYAAGAAGPQKWSDFSIDPDNPTYRETVLHLPQKSDAERLKAINEAESSGRPMPRGTDFQSGHWSEPNIIAHARTSIQKDAQGKDVFVVNELQSDWGQKIRDGGISDPAKASTLRAREKELKAELKPDTVHELGAFDYDYGQLVRQLEALVSKHPDDPRAAILDDLKAFGAEKGAELKRVRAEAYGAETGAPGHPLVNTTDQWVNTGFRRMIAQAVESGADQIAIPSGETIKAFGMGGKEDGIKYAYDEMYPKNLRNILKKIDPSIEPVKVDHLYGQKGQALERSRGFVTFKITPKLREAVKKEGLPLFTGGVPVDGSANNGERE